eukprot:jgi/Botrbrau1/11372/Bobra.0038s0119.2
MAQRIMPFSDPVIEQGFLAFYHKRRMKLDLFVAILVICVVPFNYRWDFLRTQFAVAGTMEVLIVACTFHPSMSLPASSSID